MEKKSCEICGGSGQVGFFQGVSRFLLTWEECPACNGVGFKFPPKGGRPAGDGEAEQEEKMPSGGAASRGESRLRK